MKRIAGLFVLFFFSTTLFAQSIQELVFFGDSLSDNGNLYRKVKVIPKSPPYYNGQFSNGLVWAELIKGHFAVSHGTLSQNYAVGGATAVFRHVRDGALPFYLKRQVNDYIKSQHSTDKASVLYFLWMGANDYLDEKNAPVNALVKEVVDEIVANIRVLIEGGGRNFVIFDLPEMSKVPYAKDISHDQRERLGELSRLHHQEMVQAVNRLKGSYPAFKFLYIDSFTIFNDAIINIESYNQKYHKHIVNLTDACWLGTARGLTSKNGNGINSTMQEVLRDSVSLRIAADSGEAESSAQVPCSKPDDYFFWDKVHPSAVAHEILATVVAEKVEKEFIFD